MQIRNSSSKDSDLFKFKKMTTSLTSLTPGQITPAVRPFQPTVNMELYNTTETGNLDYEDSPGLVRWF